MDTTYLFKDRPAEDPLGQTSDPAVLLQGKRGDIHTLLYGIADGEKHPVMLILHGFPGAEKNLDLAQEFRRIGFNVFTMNYSGSWGSTGPFSFANAMEDVRTMIDFIKGHDVVEGCHMDEDQFFLCGHSMGGFITLRTLAAVKGIKAGCVIAPYDFGQQSILAETDSDAKKNLDDLLAEGGPWLDGTDNKALRQELLDHDREYAVSNITKELSRVPLMVVAAKYDECAVTKIQGRFIYDSIEAENGGLVHYKELPTDHGFSNSRCALAETVGSWFVSNVE